MPRKKLDKAIFDLDIAFAQLELAEVAAGKRTLKQCPGVEKVASHIRNAKRVPRR